MRYEVRNTQGQVIYTTYKASTYEYMVRVYNIVEQVASRVNYIVVDGFRFADMAAMATNNIEHMLATEVNG